MCLKKKSTCPSDTLQVSRQVQTYFLLQIFLNCFFNAYNKNISTIVLFKIPSTHMHTHINIACGIKQWLLPLYVFVMLAELLILICSFMATLIVQVRFADQSPSLPLRHFHVPSSNLTPARTPTGSFHNPYITRQTYTHTHSHVDMHIAGSRSATCIGMSVGISDTYTPIFLC